MKMAACDVDCAVSSREERRLQQCSLLIERIHLRLARSQRALERKQERHRAQEDFMRDLSNRRKLLDFPAAPILTPTVEEWANPLQYISSYITRITQYGGAVIRPPQVLSEHVKIPTAFRFQPRIQAFPQTNILSPKNSLKMRARRLIKENTRGFSVDNPCTISQLRKKESKLQREWTNKELEDQEAAFWTCLESGFYGQTSTLRYGVDVVVDGAHHRCAKSRPRCLLPTINKSGNSVLRHLYYLCGPSRAHFTLVLMINNTGSALMARADLRLFVTKDILYTSGAAKTWYIVPASDAVKVEVTAGKLGLSLRQLLRKDSMISPDLLKKDGVTVYRATQQQGDIVITLPQVYHQGFNHGLNVAEAVNWACCNWLPYGCMALVRDTALFVPTPVPVESLIWSEYLSQGSYHNARDLRAILESLQFVLSWEFEHTSSKVLVTKAIHDAPLAVRKLARLWSDDSSESTSLAPMDNQAGQLYASHENDVVAPRCGRCFHFCFFGFVADIKMTQSDLTSAMITCIRCCDTLNPNNVLFRRVSEAALRDAIETVQTHVHDVENISNDARHGG